ncbi:hypothetical protein HYFRA_00006675 [Hymenoscyphus fraxineus]|uniref:Uncharacterized protein n=1 Tax=Hymenoscyphus fraxineus TaxID=746836 RepID=A0A9N9KUL7_9HELO|nr:hypothetical protein HYFRA_00006675 [Hymenoscyphus fraxineus]
MDQHATVICYCPRCHQELARFRNSWKAIGKTYFTPNYPLLDHTHGFLRYGEPTQAAANSPVANCFTQDVICKGCLGASIGLQCVSAPANHIFKKDQFLLRLKNIALISESSGLPVEPCAEQTVMLNPEGRRNSSSGARGSIATPRDRRRSMHLPSERLDDSSRAQSIVAAAPSNPDPDISGFMRWAQSSIESQRKDIARISSAVNNIEGEMTMFRSFMAEVRNEQKESQKFRANYEQDKRAVGKVGVDLRTLGYRVDSLGRKEEARGISGQSLSRDIEIIVSDMRRLYEDVSQVGDLKRALTEMARQIVVLERKTDQPATEQTTTQTYRENEPLDHLQRNKVVEELKRQIQGIHNRVSIVEHGVHTFERLVPAQQERPTEQERAQHERQAQQERLAQQERQAQQQRLAQANESTVPTPKSTIHNQEGVFQALQALEAAARTGKLPVQRTVPRVEIPPMKSKDPQQQTSRFETRNSTSESTTQHNHMAEKQSEQSDNSLKRKKAHVDANSSIDQSVDDDQPVLPRKRGRPRRNPETTQKPTPARQERYQKPTSPTPDRLLSPTPDPEIIEISSSPPAAPAQQQLLTSAPHAQGLDRDLVHNPASDSSGGLQQGQTDTANNANHTNSTEKVPLREDPSINHNHTPTNTTTIRNGKQSRRMSLRRPGTSSHLDGSAQNQGTPKFLELGKIRAANGLLLTSSGKIDGRSLRYKVISDGDGSSQLQGDISMKQRRTSMPANAKLPSMELRENVPESRKFSPALVPNDQTAKTHKYQCPVCSATYDYAGGLSYHKRNSACYVDGVENPDGAREEMLAARENVSHFARAGPAGQYRNRAFHGSTNNAYFTPKHFGE